MRKQYLYIICSLLLVPLFFTACNNEPEKETTDTNTTNNIPAPVQIPYTIVASYPHDNTAFTEGLQYADGILYESTGQKGRSDVRKTDLQTGKILQQQKLEDRYFGEGMTVMNGKLYQLTYQENTGFVYDAKTLKLLQTFSFPNKEGWGVTNDSTYIIYSDGTDGLFYLDPATLKEVKRIQVKDQYGPVLRINELEFIKGYIYANQWETDFIYKIDPKTGYVAGIADLRNLRAQTGILPLGQATDETQPEVMNGIAYDAATNRIFITGKNWPKLFEIKLDN